jgi:hypothetical protein
MDIFEQFPSKYLKASDLRGQQARVVMEQVTTEDIGQDRRAILYFKGKQKGLVLNKTNASTIAESYGQNTDGWEGKEITLYPSKTDYQGKRVDCIRLQIDQPRPRRPQPTPAAAPAPVHDERNPPLREEMNDDIPW